MFDKHQFEQLYRLYYEDCIRFAYSFMKETADAEEVVQEVFLKLWQKKDEINIETSPKGYLLTAVRNKAYEYFRKKASSPKVIAEEYAPASLSVNELHFENKELDISIKQAISNLPEKCREAFLLSRDEQLKYKEIAEKMDISIKTVENHIGKALKILHSSIEHLLIVIIFLTIFLM
jgi:RNA polymerase sigma-70 factor (ECF subfamily)